MENLRSAEGSRITDEPREHPYTEEESLGEVEDDHKMSGGPTMHSPGHTLKEMEKTLPGCPIPEATDRDNCRADKAPAMEGEGQHA